MKAIFALFTFSACLLLTAGAASAHFSVECDSANKIVTITCDSACDLKATIAGAPLYPVIVQDEDTGDTEVCYLHGSVDELVFIGSDEDDSIYPHPSFDDAAFTAFGGDGNDHIIATGNNINTLWGEDGDDYITLLSCDVHGSSAMGGKGNDTIHGTYSYNDTLKGGKGNDTIYGYGGHDIIVGHRGNDVIDAGDGNDTIYGGGDNDTITGGDGNDTIYGGGGTDSCSGNAGNDDIIDCE